MMNQDIESFEWAQTLLTQEEKLNLRAKTGKKKLSDAIRIAVMHYLNCMMEQ